MTIHTHFPSHSRRQGRPLSDIDLREIAPSIFADHPHESRSEKYRFIPTSEVLAALRAEGFVPYSAAQGRCRIEGNAEFTKHVIRFRSESARLPARVGDCIPELVLMNAHDGSGGYSMLAGLMRLACLNGLMVNDSELGIIRARHAGPAEIVRQIIEGSFEIIRQMPAIAEKVETWGQILLLPPAQKAFAAAALELRDATLKPEPEALLQARRVEDGTANGSRDLWRTFNVVQENLVRGGVAARNANGRRAHTRAINSVAEDTRLNKALWQLAESMAKLAA